MDQQFKGPVNTSYIRKYKVIASDQMGRPAIFNYLKNPRNLQLLCAFVMVLLIIGAVVLLYYSGLFSPYVDLLLTISQLFSSLWLGLLTFGVSRDGIPLFSGKVAIYGIRAVAIILFGVTAFFSFLKLQKLTP